MCRRYEQDVVRFGQCTVKAASLFGELCQTLTAKQGAVSPNIKRIYCHAALNDKPMIAEIGRASTTSEQAAERACNQAILVAMNSADERLLARRDTLCDGIESLTDIINDGQGGVMRQIANNIGFWLALVWVGQLLTGCADSHQVHLSPELPSPRIQAGQSLYMALARDGAYGEHHYPGSGLMLSQAIATPLLKRLTRVELARHTENLNEALSSARKGGYDLLCYPQILHWEDRATEWSARSDKVTVKLTLFEVASANALRSALIEGQSGLATFGGDHPQDLLPAPLEAFTDSLF